MEPFPTRPLYAHGQRARRTGGLDVLDRVQLAGRPLKIEHSEVVIADGFRRQLAHGPGWAGRPPIEKLADFGIKLGHATSIYGGVERDRARRRFARRARASTTCAGFALRDEQRACRRMLAPRPLVLEESRW
jgi:hypothetical protein